MPDTNNRPSGGAGGTHCRFQFWNGLGRVWGWVGLVIFASAVMHVSRVGSRRHAQFEKDLQSEIQIALGWDRWAPHGVSVTTWTE